MVVKASNREMPLKTGPSVEPGRSGSDSSNIKEETVSVEIKAEPTPEDLKAWESIQIPYKNLAGSDEERDRRATNYVTKVIQHFQEEQGDVHETWMLIRRLMDGMRSEEGEGEVAELYMAMERMVPRIEEQVLGMDEWFRSHGRERGDKEQSKKIDAFLSAQLEIDRFRGNVQPAIRTMLSYGFACVKTFWDIKTEERVVRKYKTERVQGRDKLTCKLTKEDKVVFNGPRAQLVDPFDFFIDTDCTDIKDASYVGDITKMTLDEINDLSDRGIFKNTEALKDESPLGRTDYSSWYKDDRDNNHRTGIQRGTHDEVAEGGPKSFYVCELWGRFDLDGTGRTRECVITVVNFRVPVRIQENPYDDKHRPYAVGRANRDAFTFFSIGPFDNAVRPQLEMNQHRSLGLRSHKQSMCPVILLNDQGDMPDNLWELEPGAVLQVDAGALQGMQQIQAKSTLGEMRFADSILANNIEEITGSTRLLSGTEDSGTATEATQKLSESSRRLRSYVHSYTMMLNDMLEQFHALNQQYVTGPMKFRVLGKEAKGLEAYETMDPEVLQGRLDFTFTALGSLHSGDLVATQLMQFLNLTAPVAAKYPGMVNEPLLLKMLAQHIVGGVDAADIVHIPTRSQDLVTQHEENWMLAQGQKVQVDQLDDDEEHLESLIEWFGMDLLFGDGRGYEDISPKVIENIKLHYQAHHSSLQQKRAEKKREQQGNGGPFAMPQQQLESGRGTTGNQQMPNGPDVVNKQGSNSSAPGSKMGQTNGSPNMGQVPAADRTQGFFQSENSV